MFIDSHCHLDYPQLIDQIDDVLERARMSNIETLLTICTKISDFLGVLKIAETYPHIFCSVGVHPHEATTEKSVTTVESLVHHTNHKKVVAIGETGLDYYYNHSDKKDQWDNFEKHIIAAQKTRLPLIIHTRDADQDTIDILRNAHQDKPISGVIHCFSSSKNLAFKMLDLGFYISLSGILTFKSAADIQQTVAELPLEKLLIETDSPYLAPVPHRGKTNEPSFVTHVAQKLSIIKNINIEEVGKQTTKNFYTLFTKCKI